MTAQIREILLYKGEEYFLATEPLSPYLKAKKISLPRLSTACYRGYRGEWEISEDGKLFLVELFTSFDEEDSILKDLFPDQDRVFAKWFSGEIRMPYGQMLEYIHAGYASIYEKDLILTFEDGVLTDERRIENDVEAILKEREIRAQARMPEKKKSFWQKLFRR